MKSEEEFGKRQEYVTWDHYKQRYENLVKDYKEAKKKFNKIVQKTFEDLGTIKIGSINTKKSEWSEYDYVDFYIISDKDFLYKEDIEKIQEYDYHINLDNGHLKINFRYYLEEEEDEDDER